MWYVVFSLELQVYVWNALVFSLAWGRVVTSRLKSGPSGIYHTHWFTVYPTVQAVGTYECWIYFKGEKGLCTQRCATVYRQELPKKGPKEVDCVQLLYHSSDCDHTRANSAQGEGTRRLKRVDVNARFPSKHHPPLHFRTPLSLYTTCIHWNLLKMSEFLLPL